MNPVRNSAAAIVLMAYCVELPGKGNYYRSTSFLVSPAFSGRIQ
jgi:hypothetical protein